MLLTVLVLLPGVLLSGCIVLPMGPSYVSGSVGLDRSVPSFIAPGKTTRADLWRELGPAYREAQDGSWLCYGALYDVTGRVVIVHGAGDVVGANRRTLEIRRFFVDLDEAGIVRQVRASRIVCQRGGEPSFAYRCVDEAGTELPRDFWYETDYCWQ